MMVKLIKLNIKQAFTCNLNKELYKVIIEEYLFPYTVDNFDDNHFIHQDNDPKHSSKLCKTCFEDLNLNWVNTLKINHN